MPPTNILQLADPANFKEKENLYLEVRRREGRVLNDAALQQLPLAPVQALKQEWQQRARSFQRIQAYLNYKFKGPIRILDLGCGNGWMSNALATNANWQVTAVDLNMEELEQADRVFNRDNLTFVYADILAAETGANETFQGKFEVIVLAAAVQYFPDIKALVSQLRKLLKPSGEIHFIDSHFYPNATAAKAASNRTLSYYTKIGVPELAEYYHHHLMPDILKLGAEDLNQRPSIWVLQKLGWLAPFPWIRLRAQ